jgi:hypothetical protein
MADYGLIGLNKAVPDGRVPTSADRGVIYGGVLVGGLAELDGGADIDGVRVATVSDTNPLARAIAVQMTAAASGSNGIQQLDNDNLDMGTNDFTLHWEGALPDWTPSDVTIFIRKYEAAAGFDFRITSGGSLSLLISDGASPVTYTATSAAGLSNGAFAKITAVVTRETAVADGIITFYINGAQNGSAVSIPARTPPTVSNSIGLYTSGSEVRRVPSTTQASRLFNRALTAAEVLDLSINGVALADRGASQTSEQTADFSAGVDGYTANSGTDITGNQDSIDGEDDWLKIERTGANNTIRIEKSNLFTDGRNAKTSGVKVYNASSSITRYVGVFVSLQATIGSVNVADEFVEVPPETSAVIPVCIETALSSALQIASTNNLGVISSVGTGAVVYVKGITTKSVGLTSELLASNAQSDTGQIFDTAGNKTHGLLPASGATIVNSPAARKREVRWTNTWSGTHELQYIGGVNQAILPANAYIESIIGTVSGATPHDIIVGDGSDADRYVTITTGLAAGTTSFALAARTTDGTNLKLTVDPDTNATMSIAWLITYRTLEG